ncbi:MAG: SusC/RagA family TonB-linked outer membrane protein [Clostridium sp.]|nr:SusC/RagA family TonB-linked outer membrane protein [Clostridium sp.]
MNTKSKLTILISAACVCGTATVSAAESALRADTVAVTDKDARAVQTVKGYVVDARNGAPIYGVRVSVYNGKQTAMTDEKGQFVLEVEQTPAVLLVSTMGYRSCYIISDAGNPEKVALHQLINETDDEGLSPVSSYSSTLHGIGQGADTDHAVTTRLLGSVYGSVNSGTEANGSSIFVRGIHSLNTSSQPLYIVDGVVWQSEDPTASVFNGYYHSPLALLPADDIAEIRVLSPAEAAVYGSKGGNGVIQITTKRATDMATKIEAYATVGFSLRPNTMPVMNAENYRGYLSDMISGYIKDPSQLEAMKFLNYDPSKSYYYENHAHTDWNDCITKVALKQNYGVNIKGGDERALYTFSLGYTRNDGNIRETDMDRINIRINSDINLTKHFKTRFDFAFSQINRQAFDDGMDLLSSPTYLAMVKSPFYAPNRMDAQGNVLPRLSDVDELNVGNPMAILEGSDNNIKQYRFNFTLSPTYVFNDKWRVNALFNYSWDKIKENGFLPDYGVASTSLTNEQGEVYAVAQNRVRTLMASQKSIEAGLSGVYTPFRDAVKSLQVEAGYKFYNDSYESAFGEGYNTGSDNIKVLQQTVDATRTVSGDEQAWRSIAWYATADFSWLYRYYLSAGLTFDTSSRFGREAKDAIRLGGLSWGLFPSVEAAWVMSSEKWMSRTRKYIDLWKWKVGYSVAGNDRLPANATRAYFGSVNYLGQGYGLLLQNVGNPELKWETTGTFTAGLELSTLNRRLQLGLDWYTSKTSDVLMPAELDNVAGLGSYWSNNGTMRNRGVEFSATGRLVNRKNFLLDAGLSIGHFHNKITAVDGGETVVDVMNGQVLYRKDCPAGLFYGYEFNGVLADKAAADAANLSVRTETGSLKAFEAGDALFTDFNNDGVIDEADRTVIGDPTPDIYGNFHLTARYKRFELSTMFTYSLGGDVYNAYRANLESGSQLINQTRALENRWMIDGQCTDVPRATYGDPMGNARFSSRWIEDGSYLRWSSLTLSYTLPVKSNYLEKVHVFATANNLCTWTGYLGADPAFSMGGSTVLRGIDGGLTAASPSILFGVKINL